MMKLQLLKYLGFWLVIAFVITAVAGLVYVTVHQSLRQSANDPQIQMAEDMANDLSAGVPYSNYDESKAIDLSRSLAPFFIIFDEQGHPIVSNGRLDGEKPSVPIGVLEHARSFRENRVTWQPQSNVRVALVVAPVSGVNVGFVAVGRSLREVEIRERRLAMTVELFWIFSLAVTFVLILLLYFLSNWISR